MPCLPVVSGIMSSVGFVENSTKATAIEREE